MTTLKEKIIRRIKTAGPMSIAEFMAECLFNPEHGYYQKRQPFGAKGDFITAPDISQMFGELTALWLIEAWHQLGAPKPFTLCEIGPGRGTWMLDILRTAKSADRGFFDAANIELIEKSEALHKVQREALAACGKQINWANDIEALSAQPTLLIANELFDAIPTRQYVKTSNGWLERIISIDDNENPIFSVGEGSIDPSIVPPVQADDGAIFEYAPAREALAQQIGEHIAAHQGAALIIDYGHAQSSLGDTFQGVQNHQYVDVLENPGNADLTSHVDFEALNIAAKNANVTIYEILTQADFLLALGLVERAGILGAGKDEKAQQQISQAVHRLAGNGENQMGDLFKAMCITSRQNEPLKPFKFLT